jgi:flagellar biosynthesis protein FlhA
VPSLLSLGTVLRVVKNLLRENVSIRDLRSILETLADYGGITKDPETLTEFVRQSLGRYIVEQYKRDDDSLWVLTMDREVEEVVADAVQMSEQGSYLAIEPATAQKILAAIRKAAEKFDQTGTAPVIIASPSIRRHMKKLTDRYMPNLAVISHNEIPPSIKIQSIGMVSLDAS